VKPRAIHGQIVQFEVAFRGRDRGSRHVYGVRAASAGGRGVHGKPARVPEQVQHGFTARALGHSLAVLALVKEQASLLSVRQVNDEPQAVFQDFAFVLWGACLARCPVPHTPDREPRSRRQAQPRLKRLVESARTVPVEAHDRRVEVIVDVHAGQQISLAVHPPKRVRLRQIQLRQPAVQRGPQPFRHEAVLVCETIPGPARFQHSHCDG